MKLYKSHLLGATMNLTQLRIYFWGGIFSQWAECNIELKISPFVHMTFNCAEQFMMYEKAMLFDDEDAAERILSERDPRNQKAIGRTIKNFDEKIWDDHKFEIVKNINYLKFSQNQAWKELLIYTHGYELVEASPHDTIYGIGLSEDDPLILNCENWRGQNLLGKAIMAARKQIIEEL